MSVRQEAKVKITILCAVPVDLCKQQVLLVVSLGDRDVISSYHIYASCFSTMMWGKL